MEVSVVEVSAVAVAEADPTMDPGEIMAGTLEALTLVPATTGVATAIDMVII